VAGPGEGKRGWSRRRLLVAAGSVAGVAVAGFGGAYELVSHGVVPGKSVLAGLDGACSVPGAGFAYPAGAGPAVSGTFRSAARGRDVGYTIGYPPGARPGDALPLIVMLHGFGASHQDALSGLTPAQAVALRPPGARPLPPMALVTVDGGDGYWNPHPGDDPMAMLVDELIPRCARAGLGRDGRVAVMGISMGGYGALLLGERHPGLVRAVAAISPAIWTSYAQARAANAGAFASAAAFAAADVVAHAGALAGTPVRVAAGYSDPFYPGVRALAAALPAGAVTDFAPGCHTGPFFQPQEVSSLQFAGDYLGP
jgi:S-formylglutathione hydrolase FrmB